MLIDDGLLIIDMWWISDNITPIILKKNFWNILFPFLMKNWIEMIIICI